MEGLERERDFYRQQYNELGAKVLRLQGEQTRVQREARRSRTVAMLIREAHRLAGAKASTDEVGQRFLRVILDTLNVDRAAFLKYSPEQGCFVAQHTLGFPLAEQPGFAPPDQPGEYCFANSNSAPGPLLDCLRQAAGVPYLLWAFNRRAGVSLLMGNATEDQHLHRPFEEGDREIVESALNVFIDIAERKRLELQRAQLFERSQKALAETEALYEGSERVVRATTLDDVLQALIHSTALGKFERANIMLFDRPWGDERPENLIVTAVWEHSGEETRAPVGTSYPTDKSPLMSLVARNKPTIFSDVATAEGMDENLRALLIERLHMRSLVLWPLVTGEQWIGILAGQSNTVLAMNEDEVRQITSLADQAAAVIQNQRLLDQTQEALEEVEATHRLYLREQWTKFVPARVAPFYERARSGVAPLGDATLPQVERAMAQREVVVQSSGDEQSAVVAPITLRGEVIGALGLHETESGRQWTDDEIALVESVAEQLALAVENVRLLEETQRRAQRDRIIADITAKVRSSADVETIMRTAVRELGTALNTDRAFVQLSTGTSVSSGDSGHSGEEPSCEGEE